jgi:DNA-binding NarL/FixJ family response regulator
MKAFVIISNDSLSRSGMMVSVVSAFASIDSIGAADNLVEAVDLIRQRYPNAVIFDSRLFEEGRHSCLLSVLDSKGSFVLLPRNGQFNDKCIYIGIDFSEGEQKEWLLNEISRTLLEYHASPAAE